MSKQIGVRVGWFTWGMWSVFVLAQLMLHLQGWMGAALFVLYVTAWALVIYAYRKSRA